MSPILEIISSPSDFWGGLLVNRVMGDSVTLSAIPLTVNVAAAYVNGHLGVVSPAQMQARFPHDRHGWVFIDVTGANANTADVLDVETGDATPGIANLWVQSFHVLKRSGLPVVYVNRGNEAAVVAACASGGSVLGKTYGLWVATLDGTQVNGPGIVACQWKSHGTWDESVVYDSSIWLPVAPVPAPKPPIPTPPVPRPTLAVAEAALKTLTEFVEAA